MHTLITYYQDDLNLDKWAEVLIVEFLYSKVIAHLPYIHTCWKQVTKHRTHSSLGGGKGKVKLNSWSGEGICIVWNSSVLEIYLFFPPSFILPYFLPSFLFLPPFIYLFIIIYFSLAWTQVRYFIIWITIQYYIIYYNKCSSFSHWKFLQIGSCVLLTCIVLFRLMKTSLLSDMTGWFRLILYIPCPNSKINHLAL